MKMYRYFLIICAVLILAPVITLAQDKEAKITLSFASEDSEYVCKALVTSEDKPVKDVNVKLFVKRLFGLLPVNDGATTGEDGIASFTVSNDIPGDATGNLVVIAKIEDDDNYMNTETKADVKWGVIRKEPESKLMERSLAASRERAPIYFMVASDLIIAGIWGTIIYIIFQVFKIKRISSLNKKSK